MLSTYIRSLHVCSHCSACFEGTFANLEFLHLCWAYVKETDAYAQATHQFLTSVLRVHISSWPICTGYASVPDAYAHHILKGLRSVHAFFLDVYAQCTRQFFMCMLSTYISPDMHAQHVFKGPLQIWNFDAYAEHRRKKLIRMLRLHISSWPVCTEYASVLDAYAQHILKGLCSVHTFVPDAYAQCTHQFLTHMLTYASVPDAHAQCTHQFLTRMLSACISALLVFWGYKELTSPITISAMHD